MSLKPYHEQESTTLYHGDALRVLRELPDASVDAVITDPPYSSGGLFRGDRVLTTGAKYLITGTQRELPDFPGDNRDMMSFALWCSLWMLECHRVTRPGGLFLTFTDWRQWPAVAMAVQCGGYVLRGCVPWDKTTAARPVMGFFRQQCEFVLTASHGSLGKEQTRQVRECLPGLFTHAVQSAQRVHQTGKPLGLMRDLLRVVPRGGMVLDPFAGGGTTLLAARQSGLQCIGIEKTAKYCREIVKQLHTHLI